MGLTVFQALDKAVEAGGANLSGTTIAGSSRAMLDELCSSGFLEKTAGARPKYTLTSKGREEWAREASGERLRQVRDREQQQQRKLLIDFLGVVQQKPGKPLTKPDASRFPISLRQDACNEKLVEPGEKENAYRLLPAGKDTLLSDTEAHASDEQTEDKEDNDELAPEELESMTGIVDFPSFREEWLAEVRDGEPSTTELGHRFARKLLTQWREIEDSSDDLVYCDGTGDGGIDIAYLDRNEGETDGEATVEGHTWYLIQSKYGSAFRGTNTLLAEAQKVIATLAGERKRLTSLVEGLLDRLMMFKQRASDRDRIVLVFATVDELNEQEKGTLDDIRAMGRNRLGPWFDVEAVSVATIYQRNLDEGFATLQPRIKLPIQANLVLSGEALLVGSISLLALYEFLKAYRLVTEDLDQLFENNVRRFLGSRGKVNKAMQQTLNNKPDRFGLYNNGITVAVADFRAEGNNKYILMDPYIVNGCQTTRTIWDVLHNRLEAGGTGKSADLEAWRQKAEQGVVVTKVVKYGVYGDSQELQEITRYTNSQNAVRERDFLTLTLDFHTWARQMADRYNIFLEVQRGGWDSRKALQKQTPRIKQFGAGNWANAFDLIKVYGSGWLGEAGTAFGRNAAFVPTGSIFKRITNTEERGSQFGVDDLYAAYRLQKAADAREFGRKAKQTRRQTRFLYYMVVMELLKGTMLLKGMPVTPRDLTQALLKLFQDSNKDVAELLLETGGTLVDDYMTRGTEDCIFDEPEVMKTGDIAGYLKGDKLGKTDEDSPHLRSQLNVQLKVLARGGALSPRELITAVIK